MVILEEYIKLKQKIKIKINLNLNNKKIFK
jgi:hypothetical protein